MKQKLTRYLTLLVGAVAGAFALVFIIKGVQSVIKEQETYAIPLRTVGERRANLEKMGVSLDEQVDGADANVLIAAISNSAWAKKSNNQKATPELAEELMKSADIKAALQAEAKATAFDSYRWPESRSFNSHTAERHSQRAAGSLLFWVREKIEAKQYDEAISGLEWLDLMSQVLAKSPDDSGVILWFGTNMDILECVYEMKSQGALTPERLAKVKPMLSYENRVYDYKKLVSQQVRESVAMARVLPDMTMEEVYTLVMKDDYSDVPKFDKNTTLAVESRMLDVWQKALVSFDQGKNSEEVGVEIDKVIKERQKDMKTTDFMVQALPDTFEQHGRLSYRVTQAKAIMQLWLDDKLEPGTHEVGEGQDKVLIEVEETGKDWRVVSKAMFAYFGFKPRKGLQVDQSEGIQLVVPK